MTLEKIPGTNLYQVKCCQQVTTTGNQTVEIPIIKETVSEAQLLESKARLELRLQEINDILALITAENVQQ